MLKTPRKIINLFFAIFTLSTLAHSIWCIIKEIPSVTHEMLVNRAVVTFLGTFVFILLRAWNFENKILRFVLPYVTFMGLSLCYTYLSGVFFAAISPSYFHMILYGTAVYLVVYGVLEFPYFAKLAYDKKQNAATKNNTNPNSNQSP